MEFVHKRMYQKNITTQIAGGIENTHFFNGKIW